MLISASDITGAADVDEKCDIRILFVIFDDYNLHTKDVGTTNRYTQEQPVT